MKIARKNGLLVGKVAILSHGLTDHHRTPLLVRLTEKLTARGVRVFRWDMRSCGAGIEWARRPYHAGCSNDLGAVVHAVIEQCCKTTSDLYPDITLFGVSLSGNVLLKYLGESPATHPHISTTRCCRKSSYQPYRWY